MIYFDAAATTLQKPPQVFSAVQKAMQTCASVGRGGHAAAQRAAETVFDCRIEAAKLFDAEAEQVIFTSNATHGLNIAIRSLVPPGAKVVTSGFEHNAVMRPLYALYAEILQAGRRLFDAQETVEAFEMALRQGVSAAVCTHCSNVFGYILPIEEIARLCRQYRVPLIIDASQSAGTLPVSLSKSGAAFIAMPGHKGLYGPQGTGILLCADGGEPLLFGGTGGNSLSAEMPDFLPDRLEAGTHNVCGLAGLADGLRYVRRRTPSAILRHELSLKKRLERELPELSIFSGKPQSGVVSFTVEGEDCEEFARRLATYGIAVRAGLHCAPSAHRTAGTLSAGTVRLSFSDFNTMQEVHFFAQIYKKLLRNRKNRHFPTCY